MLLFALWFKEQEVSLGCTANLLYRELRDIDAKSNTFDPYFQNIMEMPQMHDNRGLLTFSGSLQFHK